MSQTPRHINTDRSLSRPGQAARAPQAAPEQNTRSTAGAQHAPPPRRPAQPDMGGNDAPRRRKKKKKTPLWLPFAIVMGVIAVISGVVVYGVSLVNKVEDSIRPAESPFESAGASARMKVPPSYRSCPNRRGVQGRCGQHSGLRHRL